MVYWILGMFLLCGLAGTTAVVYAALILAARTDAIIGGCEAGAQGIPAGPGGSGLAG